MSEKNLENIHRPEDNKFYKEFQEILPVLDEYKMERWDEIPEIVERVKKGSISEKEGFKTSIINGDLFALKALEQLLEEDNPEGKKIFQESIENKNIYVQDLNNYLYNPEKLINPTEEEILDKPNGFELLKNSVRRSHPKSVKIFRKLLEEDNKEAFGLLSSLVLEGNNRAIVIFGQLIFNKNPRAIKLLEEIHKILG
uniref:Uncharacterized protein n=1 Tax=candidate division CPR3 bacterium TaxID=2268181 RepID=A0A7C4M5N4_UNCC3